MTGPIDLAGAYASTKSAVSPASPRWPRPAGRLTRGAGTSPVVVLQSENPGRAAASVNRLSTS
jgi:hypothetical protein